MTIVVGYIPTPQGDAALDVALAEARTHDTDLVVLNIARGDALQDSHRLYDDESTALEARLDATGVPYELRRELAPGRKADTLIQIAGAVGATMLVIGLRRRSPTGKWLFGSAAQELLRDAPCPVLAVKPPAPQSDHI